MLAGSSVLSWLKSRRLSRRCWNYRRPKTRLPQSNSETEVIHSSVNKGRYFCRWWWSMASSCVLVCLEPTTVSRVPWNLSTIVILKIMRWHVIPLLLLFTLLKLQIWVHMSWASVVYFLPVANSSYSNSSDCGISLQYVLSCICLRR